MADCCLLLWKFWKFLLLCPSPVRSSLAFGKARSFLISDGTNQVAGQNWVSFEFTCRPDEFKHEESMFTLSTKYHFFFPAYFLHLIALDSLILVSHSVLIIADTITSQLGAKLSRCRARILGSSVSAIGGWRGIMKCSLFHYSCSKISIIPVQKISLFRFTKSHYSGQNKLIIHYWIQISSDLLWLGEVGWPTRGIPWR